MIHIKIASLRREMLAGRRMWALLQLHAKQCTQADCPVPRCPELRLMKRRQMARQEEKRRQGYAHMLRQQVFTPLPPPPFSRPL